MSRLKIIVVFYFSKYSSYNLLCWRWHTTKPLNFINFHHHSCIMCFYWQQVWKLWKISN